MNQEMADDVERRLVLALNDQPTGLAAAIAEVRSCRQFPEYLRGILPHFPDGKPIDKALFLWALRRAEIWAA